MSSQSSLGPVHGMSTAGDDGLLASVKDEELTRIAGERSQNSQHEAKMLFQSSISPGILVGC